MILLFHKKLIPDLHVVLKNALCSILEADDTGLYAM